MAGEIELLTARVLSGVVGYDAAGLAGVQDRVASIPHPGFAAGDYIIPLTIGTVQDRVPSTSAQATAWPVFFRESTPLDRIGVYLTTAQAGAAAMFGLYTNSGGRPKDLLLDAGELSLAAGGGANALQTIAYTVPPGLYWAVCWMKNVATQATVKGPTATLSGLIPQAATVYSTSLQSSLTYTGAYPASLPAVAPAFAPSIINTVPAVLLRAA